MKTGLKTRGSKQSGYVMMIIVLLLAVAALGVTMSQSSTQTFTRTTKLSDDRSEDFYASEESLNTAVNWLRTNSTGLAMGYSRTNFYTLFDRTAPSVGTNDASTFTVPTKIKMNGSNNSVFLSTAAAGATSNLPSMTDTVTGTAFNASGTFDGSPMGDHEVRVTLVDAIAIDPTKDYGDTSLGNPSPDTDFNPVYRVDAFRALTGGSHLLGYIVGQLVLDYGVGFYGRDFVEARQDCDSYLSNNGAYGAGTKRANCTVGSNGEVRVLNNEIIYGSARTNGSFNTASPWGGKICADFVANCPNAGQTCSGGSCAVPALPTYSPWATYCPSNQGDLTIAVNSTLTVPGNAPNQKCWNAITINNNRTLTLTSTQYPYFIDTFNIANNSQINFQPSPATGTINIYVRNITGDSFNGNQMFNTNNKPYQLRIHYLGTDPLTLNGTAMIKGFIVAPYAGVTISGNFDYQGGVKATSLTMTGSGAIHYDESGDVTTISDTSYEVRQVEEHYK